METYANTIIATAHQLRGIRFEISEERIGTPTGVPAQETRKFYQKLNASGNGFVPRAEFCRNKDGSLLTVGRDLIERWKQHFDEHLNGVENVGMLDQGNEGNDYISAVEDGGPI